jgi:cyclic lactone autoinducer peptide
MINKIKIFIGAAILSGMAATLTLLADIFTNSTACFLFFYQPKIPKSMIKK